MLPIVPGTERIVRPLPVVTATLVPIVHVVTMSEAGEIRSTLFSWRNSSNVHRDATARIESTLEARGTVLAVIEGEEDMATGETSVWE